MEYSIAKNIMIRHQKPRTQWLHVYIARDNASHTHLLLVNSAAALLSFMFFFLVVLFSLALLRFLNTSLGHGSVAGERLSTPYVPSSILITDVTGVLYLQFSGTPNNILQASVSQSAPQRFLLGLRQNNEWSSLSLFLYDFFFYKKKLRFRSP